MAPLYVMMAVVVLPPIFIARKIHGTWLPTGGATNKEDNS